jgi:hypothetical protein
MMSVNASASDVVAKQREANDVHAKSVTISLWMNGVRRTGEGGEEDGGGGAEGSQMQVSQGVEQGEVGGGEAGDERGDVDEVVRQVARCVVEGAGGGELRGRGGHIG